MQDEGTGDTGRPFFLLLHLNKKKECPEVGTAQKIRRDHRCRECCFRSISTGVFEWVRSSLGMFAAVLLREVGELGKKQGFLIGPSLSFARSDGGPREFW